MRATAPGDERETVPATPDLEPTAPGASVPAPRRPGDVRRAVDARDQRDQVGTVHYRSEMAISRTVCSEQAVPTVALREVLSVVGTIEPPCSTACFPLTEVCGGAGAVLRKRRVALARRNGSVLNGIALTLTR